MWAEKVFSQLLEQKYCYIVCKPWIKIILRNVLRFNILGFNTDNQDQTIFIGC